MKKVFRKLVIQSKFRKRAYDSITIPEIRLQGKWLDKMGFKEGHAVKIELDEQRLVITLM